VALEQEPAIEVQTATRANVTMPAQPEKKSLGSTVDSTIQTKMDGVREQFEQALVKQLDKIKITVADSDEQNAPAAPVETTVVTDSVINSHSAAPEKAGYMSIESAPVIADDAGVAEESVAKTDEGSKKNSGIKFSPIIGRTIIGSDYYNIDSRYTLGVEVEMDLDDSLSAVLGYSYSQYDIGLSTTNPFYVAQPMGFGYNGFGTLGYNQNVFEGALRVYLMPRDSKFRAFIGGGLGYNKGYVNYSNRYTQNYAFNPYQNSPDYEVNSFLGILQAGAEVNVSKSVSIGALFKYDQILSSNENQPLNNYGFINQGYNGYQIGDKQIVGGSLAKQSFYSILGTVKVAF
jgi:hypothetical protein